jgi:hypothetical protein
MTKKLVEVIEMHPGGAVSLGWIPRECAVNSPHFKRLPRYWEEDKEIVMIPIRR